MALLFRRGGKVKIKTLLQLFYTFFKIGSFTFGGGYAMLPLIEREVVDNRRWINQQELIDILALAQTAPGAIAVNSSIFIGKRVAGVLGALIAVIGMVLPSFVVISIIAVYLHRYSDNVIAAKALRGIRPAVVTLIILAVLRIGKSAVYDKVTMIIAAGAFISLTLNVIDPILAIISGGVVGIVITLLWPGREVKNRDAD
ncbi:MAG: chromate transporter [Mahellales bacterium]|jgi:chromate transporter